MWARSAKAPAQVSMSTPYPRASASRLLRTRQGARVFVTALDVEEDRSLALLDQQFLVVGAEFAEPEDRVSRGTCAGGA